MSLNTYILVFPSDSLWLEPQSNPLTGLLGIGGVCYTLDGNIAFLRTARNLEDLTATLSSEIFNGRQFLLVDMNEADRAGVMMPVFWDRFSREERQDAAA